MMAAAFAACTVVSSEAEAKGCNDHVFNQVYSSQNRTSSIPKTRRTVSSRKKRIAPAAIARPAPKPAVAQQVVRAPATERPYEPDVVEELDLEWFGYDLITDDPRRNGAPRLLYHRISLGMATVGDPSPIVSQRTVARPAYAAPVRLLI